MEGARETLKNKDEDLEKVRYIKEMVEEYGFTIQQAQDMYKALKKLPRNNDLTLEEAVKLAKGN